MWMIDQSSTLAVWLNVLYLLCRYAHLVGAMLLVGGFLFYEMVVPQAIAELTEPSQLAVFARARWVFRWVTWGSIVVIILTGAYLTVYRMQTYIESEFIPNPSDYMHREAIPWALRTGWWWAAHVLSAGFAILVALHLVSGDRPISHPVSWLRFDLMLLLVVVFFATVTRQVDQIHHQRAMNLMFPPALRTPAELPSDIETPQTLPAVPATQP
jgi:hypothetical protein